MSAIHTIAAVSATAGTPTPIYTGPVTAAVSFSISNGLATVVLGSLPVGYGKGQKVTLWGFTTATYFNGLSVTVTENNPALFSFSFPTTEGNVGSTDDAGNTAPAPVQKFRAVRIEADKGNSTHGIYVGDSNVSSSRYTAQLLYGGVQQSIWIGGEGIVGQNIDASLIFLDTDSTGAKAQVSLFY
jgi:hypothetical protein